MYTDGSIGGDEETVGRDAQPITAEEWIILERLFSSDRTREVLVALRLNDNDPVEVSEFTEIRFTRSVLGGMCSVLTREKVELTLALLYPKKPMRANKVFFKRVVRPKVTDFQMSQIRAAPCH